MTYRELFLWGFCIVQGFVLGGIMFCRHIPRIFLHIDICEISEDHNPGAANVFLCCGAFWGMLCLTLDIVKGFWPVFLACHLVDVRSTLFGIVLAAPVIGHAIAPFDRSQGGKCIATSFGVLLGAYSVSRIVFLLAGLYIILSTVLKIPSTRRRSIATFALFGMTSVVHFLKVAQLSLALGCTLISAIAIAKHTRRFCSDPSAKEKCIKAGIGW